MIPLSVTEPVASKEHLCEWCGETIEKGEQHKKFAQIFDGSFQSWRAHYECIRMMGFVMHDGVHMAEDGFRPYSNRRGKKPEEIVAARLRGDQDWEY